jgi:predicted dehydrogenase
MEGGRNMSVNKVIRVGLIGLGGMADAHRRMISELDQLRLSALCDVNEELLHKVGEDEGIGKEKRFHEMESLIRDPDVDAVISIVPNDLHANVLELCIRHQKPIMAEKPFTLNFKEAEYLSERYEKTPIPCMVGFSYRYIPAFRYAKQLLEENKIGTVRHMEVRYLQSFGAPIFEVPYLWRFNKAVTGTGALGDLGAHMIDSARFLVGEFKSVSALMRTFVPERRDLTSGSMDNVEVDDYASFLAQLEHDVVGTFLTTRNAIGSGNQHEVTLYGDVGTIHVNCEKPDEVRLSLVEGKELQTSEEILKVPPGYRRQQLEDFTALVTGQKQEGIPDFHDGYQNQKVLERIIESAETGQSVSIDQ